MPAGDVVSVPDIHLGRVLGGRYRIESLIGAGSMGRVYRASQEVLAKTVAVKVLNADLSTDPQAAGRFAREAQAASRFDHPNSVAVFDFGREPDGTAYLVMEYLCGETLGAMLRREGRLSCAQCVAIMAEVLAALIEAHQHGIVHRDLKPENIMLARASGPDRYTVKVADFGIAKILDGGSASLKLTATGITQGSPAYMSPEQVQARPVDARSDLYQCGVVLFEMITGRTPFGGGALVDVMMRQVRAPAPSPRGLNLCCLPALERVILRALEKDPARRFADARAMRDALKAIVLDEAVEPARPRRSSGPSALATRPSAPTVRARSLSVETLRPPSRRTRFGVAAVVAASVVACAAGAALTLRSGDADAAHAYPTVVVRANHTRPAPIARPVVSPAPEATRVIVFEPTPPDGATLAMAPVTPVARP